MIPREGRWEVVVDLFFYRDPDESEKEEQQAKELVALPKPEVKADVSYFYFVNYFYLIFFFYFVNVLYLFTHCIYNFFLLFY